MCGLTFDFKGNAGVLQMHAQSGVNKVSNGKLQPAVEVHRFDAVGSAGLAPAHPSSIERRVMQKVSLWL